MARGGWATAIELMLNMRDARQTTNVTALFFPFANIAMFLVVLSLSFLIFSCACAVYMVECNSVFLYFCLICSKMAICVLTNNWFFSVSLFFTCIARGSIGTPLGSPGFATA